MNRGLLVTDHVIGGDAYHDPEEDRVQVTAPRHDARICDVPVGSKRTVAMAVSAAAASRWSQVRARDRSRLLQRLATAVDSHRVELAQTEAHDTGKSVDDAESIDIENCVRWLEYAAGWPKRIEGAVLPVDGPHLAWTEREPVGVVGAITAWNYPLMLAVWKLAPALAAGCPVVLKPSERAPLTCLLFGRLAVEAGLPPDVLNVVCGDGSTGEHLVGEPLVDKVSFTGSQEVGRQVAIACAARGKACTTELGGKSAAVVLRNGDLRQVAAEVVGGIAHNAGQACNAPSRLIYPRAVESDLFGEIDREAQRLGDVGPLIDGAALNRVERAVERAVESGREVVTTSRQGADQPNRHPLCVVKAESTDDLARTELFGPVVAAIPADDSAQATAIANDSSYDLAAGVFGELGACTQTARRLRAGHVYVNCWSVQDPCAPFGGMGGSGLGREHGREGLDAYLRTKTVYAKLS